MKRRESHPNISGRKHFVMVKYIVSLLVGISKDLGTFL